MSTPKYITYTDSTNWHNNKSNIASTLLAGSNYWQLAGLVSQLCRLWSTFNPCLSLLRSEFIISKARNENYCTFFKSNIAYLRYVFPLSRTLLGKQSHWLKWSCLLWSLSLIFNKLYIYILVKTSSMHYYKKNNNKYFFHYLRCTFPSSLEWLWWLHCLWSSNLNVSGYNWKQSFFICHVRFINPFDHFVLTLVPNFFRGDLLGCVVKTCVSSLVWTCILSCVSNYVSSNRKVNELW